LNHDKTQFVKTRNVGLVIAAFLIAAIVAHYLGLIIGAWTMFGAPIMLLFVWFFVRQDELGTK
ncbi:MAG: YoaK family protein, partial [Weissella cibaria]